MDETGAWRTAIETEPLKPGGETTMEFLERMAAYVNDPNSEEFSQAGDVEAQNRIFQMLSGRGVTRHDRFMIFMISRELWSPSAAMAFCDVLCSAAGQQAPTPADALELLGRMASWYKATMWKTEDNELARFALQLMI